MKAIAAFITAAVSIIDFTIEVCLISIRYLKNYRYFVKNIQLEVRGECQIYHDMKWSVIVVTTLSPRAV